MSFCTVARSLLSTCLHHVANCMSCAHQVTNTAVFRLLVSSVKATTHTAVLRLQSLVLQGLWTMLLCMASCVADYSITLARYSAVLTSYNKEGTCSNAGVCLSAGSVWLLLSRGPSRCACCANPSCKAAVPVQVPQLANWSLPGTCSLAAVSVDTT